MVVSKHIALLLAIFGEKGWMWNRLGIYQSVCHLCRSAWSYETIIIHIIKYVIQSYPSELYCLDCETAIADCLSSTVWKLWYNYSPGVNMLPGRTNNKDLMRNYTAWIVKQPFLAVYPAQYENILQLQTLIKLNYTAWIVKQLFQLFIQHSIKI